MKILKGYRLRSFIAIMAKMLEAIFELMMPLMMAQLIDVGIVQNRSDVVFRMSLGLLILTILGYASSLLCQFTAAQVAFRVGYAYRRRLFGKIQKFEEEDYEAFSTSGLTNRVILDINNIQDMINRVIRLGVRAPILMIGSVIALNSIHPQLAKTLILTLPLFLAVVVFFMRVSLTGHKKVTSAIDSLGYQVGESLSGARIIRAFSKQVEDEKNFNKLNNNLKILQEKVGFVTSLSGPFTSLMMNAVLVLLVYNGAFYVNEGLMTQGQMIAVINYCTQLVLTLIIAMNIVMVISKGLTSLKRIDTVLDHPLNDKYGDINNVENYQLSLENVSYHYPNEKRNVISNINIKFEEGSFVGIVGLTGSGKSTFVRLLNRLINPTEGYITLGGVELKEINLEKLREQIVIISQSAQFIKGTLKENVLMGRNGDAEKALIDAQATELLERGLDFVIEEGGKNLSGGQKQRVNIARALVGNPKVIVFDDSFSALDYLTDKNLRNTLMTKYSQVTKIVISQRVSTVREADSIVILENGRIQEVGSFDTLLVSNALFKQIYDLQRKGESYE